MSSDRLTIIARNVETGALELPLGALTLYDMPGAQAMLKRVREQYDENWWLTIYRPVGSYRAGAKPRPLKTDDPGTTVAKVPVIGSQLLGYCRACGIRLYATTTKCPRPVGYPHPPRDPKAPPCPVEDGTLARVKQEAS